MTDRWPRPLGGILGSSVLGAISVALEWPVSVGGRAAAPLPRALSLLPPSPLVLQPPALVPECAGRGVHRTPLPVRPTGFRDGCSRHP